MAATAFANLAAATAAGYKVEYLTIAAHTEQGNQDIAETYRARLTKPVYGGTHQAGFEIRADGYSTASQATAAVNAVAALNAQRNHRYGSVSGSVNDDPLGTVEVLDAS